MKIRIKDNSVRYRLSQNEVTNLVQNGETWSTCQFMTGEITYGILATDAHKISCCFENSKITTAIPKSLLLNWDTDERVGFDHTVNGLFILLEKDWQCLKPRNHEDESNLYQHPASS